MVANGLNMVRLAFQRSKLSIHHDVYLLLSASLLALSAKCTIFCVCAQHEHVRTCLKGLNKFVEYKFFTAIHISEA